MFLRLSHILSVHTSVNVCVCVCVCARQPACDISHVPVRITTGILGFLGALWIYDVNTMIYHFQTCGGRSVSLTHAQMAFIESFWLSLSRDLVRTPKGKTKRAEFVAHYVNIHCTGHVTTWWHRWNKLSFFRLRLQWGKNNFKLF